MKKAILIYTALTTALVAAPQQKPPTADEIEFFEKKIRPILVNHCYTCHSADTQPHGELRVDDPNGLLTGGNSGPAVVPGHPEQSLMLERIRSADPKRRMPREGAPLTEAEIADLTVASAVYQLPFGKGKALLNKGSAIAGGCQFTGILTLQGGLPFTPVLSFNPTNTGITTARSNRVADGNLSSGEQDPRRWFDATAFTTPAAFTFGNSERNILRGPGHRNIDIGLSRTISIRERVGLEFRAEAFNLNAAQFGLPNATLGVATTGVTFDRGQSTT
jgi:hypothetical protein